MPSVAPRFTNVNQNADPEHFVRTLDRLAPSWNEIRQHTYALLDVQEGDYLLDIGCGLGEVVRELAQRVGSRGRALGLDSSLTMVREARKRARGLDTPAEYVLGNVHALPFADSRFDGSRAERLFIHLKDPQQALAEMRRVTRSGGHLVVVDTDFGTRVLDSPDRDVTRRILSEHCDRVSNAWAGRQLFRWFKEAGLTDVMVFPHTTIVTDFAAGMGSCSFQEAAENARTAGVVTAAEAARWLAQLQQASDDGHFFHARAAFVASGRKP
jgi:ubiquinone/menaquinone biosynthesis C-methylase UbiE